jgi:putative NADH-flavin reductase
MRVVAFGANGPTGQLLTKDLLNSGYDTVAITRHPDQMGIRDDSLSVEQADATDPAAVARVIDGADAVVSVLGTKFNRSSITLYSESATLITRVMTGVGVRRLVVTSSGVVSGWADPQWNWIEANLARRVLGVLGRSLYDDMRRMEDIVTATSLDWTIMRPLGLANMDPPTKYAIAEDHIPGRQTARRDLAAAIVDQLRRKDYHRKTVAVATTNKSASIGQTIWREGIRPKLKKS